MTEQNKAIRTNCIPKKLIIYQENSKSMLCGDRDETVN